MIARAMQRSSQGFQINRTNEYLMFNKLISSWPPYGSAVPAITYNASTGDFTIPRASLSDYLVTWTVSIKTSSVIDGWGEVFLLQMNYGNGHVTEGCFSCCTTGTGLMKGFKIIHVLRVSDDDVLRFHLINNGFFNDMCLTTPLYPLPSGFTENTIFNCNICILSI